MGTVIVSISLSQKDYQRLIEAFKKAKRKDPSLTFSSFVRSLIFERMGGDEREWGKSGGGGE